MERNSAPNALAEIEPGMLFVTQKVQLAPYAPLSNAAVTRALHNVGQYRPATHVVRQSLCELYAVLNGHCGVDVADPTKVTIETRRDGGSAELVSQLHTQTNATDINDFRRLQIARNERTHAHRSKVCNYFSSSLGCHRGATCPYLHH